MDPRTKLALVTEWNRLARAHPNRTSEQDARMDAIDGELRAVGISAYLEYADDIVLGRANLAALEAEVAALDAKADAALSSPCTHPKIVEHKRHADGSIDGRCTSCGDDTFPIRDVEYERFLVERDHRARQRLRDQLAMAALTGMLSREIDEDFPTITDIASDAYRYADAMLAAREVAP